MPPPTTTAYKPRNKANDELLLKGILCTFIGLGVLVSPHFISSPGMQAIVANAQLVGWFALVLGLAFTGVHIQRKAKSSAAR